MDFQSLDRWDACFGFDPTKLDAATLRNEVARSIRQLCNDLNLRKDRPDVVRCLNRLERAGKLLEEHRWLHGL
jgi:hypothetical protein